MRTFLLVFIVGSVLSGCFWNKSDDVLVPVEVKKPIVHVSPLTELVYDKNVYVTVRKENNEYVYIENEQSFVTLTENLARGIAVYEEATAKLCHYRRELKEPSCEKYISHDVLPDAEKK